MDAKLSKLKKDVAAHETDNKQTLSKVVSPTGDASILKQTDEPILKQSILDTSPPLLPAVDPGSAASCPLEWPARVSV